MCRVPYRLSLAHEVCIPLHRGSNGYLLTISKNEAQISLIGYANLFHCAVPQRFIEAGKQALFRHSVNLLRLAMR